MEPQKPYSRREVLATTHLPPDRGPLCPTCGSRIPQFEELVGESELRVRHLIEGGRNIEAIKELQRVTSCPWRGQSCGSHIVESPTASDVQRRRVRTVVDRCGPLARGSVDFADATGTQPVRRESDPPTSMEPHDYPIRHFAALAAFATALKAIPAQVLDCAYSYESFGSWSITLRCKGITVRAIHDGREREVSLQRARTRKPPHEWDEPLWRRLLPSGELEVELQSEIVRTLHSL